LHHLIAEKFADSIVEADYYFPLDAKEKCNYLSNLVQNFDGSSHNSSIIDNSSKNELINNKLHQRNNADAISKLNANDKLNTLLCNAVNESVRHFDLNIRASGDAGTTMILFKY
jgi:hypothetical protein